MLSDLISQTIHDETSVNENNRDSFAKLCKGTTNFVMYICPHINSKPSGRILIEFGSCVLLENVSRKLKCHYNLTNITDNLHEDICTFVKYLAELFLDRETFHTYFLGKRKIAFYVR